jgi:hypothetical protein
LSQEGHKNRPALPVQVNREAIEPRGFARSGVLEGLEHLFLCDAGGPEGGCIMGRKV